MPMQSQYARCITPTQCEESQSTATTSDDEIPHLLRPDPSDNYFDEEDHCEYETHRRFLVQGVPSSPHANHDLMNASPISSISACTRGERSIISSFANLLPPVTPSSSRESSRSSSSKSSSSGVMTRNTGDSRTSKKFRCKAPPSPIELSSFPSKLHDRSHPFLKVKPRSAEYASLSPVVHSTSLTPSPTSLDGGSSIAESVGGSSMRSSRSSQRASYKVREMSQAHALRPPLGAFSNGKGNALNGSSHRRSTSLNLPPSYSSCTPRRKREEYGLGTLKEGRKVEDTFHTQSIPMPLCSTSCDLEETKHHSNASHRRTVSFPDEVLRQSRNSGQKSPRYNDLMLESDDPALFSLIETTQARSDGRVFIATDVDPFLASSGFLSLQSPPSDSDCEVEAKRREVGIKIQQLKNIQYKKKHARVSSSIDEKVTLGGENIHGIAHELSFERKCYRGKPRSSGEQNSSKGLDWKQAFPITTLPEHCMAEEDDDGSLDRFEKLCDTFPSYEHGKELKSPKDRKAWRSKEKGTKLPSTIARNTKIHVRHSKDDSLHTDRPVGQLEFQKCCIIQ